jgi:hypothetical protein
MLSHLDLLEQGDPSRMRVTFHASRLGRSPQSLFPHLVRDDCRSRTSFVKGAFGQHEQRNYAVIRMLTFCLLWAPLEAGRAGGEGRVAGAI